MSARILRDLNTVANNCTRFLNGHKARSVRQQVQKVADSPYSVQRNDQYGKGGFVADLETELANLLGKEAAVFMPSGTMAQQIALRIWSDRSGEKRVAFHPTCHLQMHEHMAYAELHGLRGVLLGNADRLFTVDDLLAAHHPISTLLIELPQREIGGQLPPWEELQTICETARSRGMKLHMDGARLWDCGPFYARPYREIAALFDSVYVSFYKILGALPGALLAGPTSFIEEARVWQRRHGGNLQQQSAAAISAKLGMEQHLPRVREYVAKAAEIADILRTFAEVRVIPEHPPTNMMHLCLKGDPERLKQAALQVAEEDKAGLFFHLDPDGKMELNVGDGTLEFTAEEIRSLFAKVFRLASEHS